MKLFYLHHNNHNRKIQLHVHQQIDCIASTNEPTNKDGLPDSIALVAATVVGGKTLLATCFMFFLNHHFHLNEL